MNPKNDLIAQKHWSVNARVHS
uniref:Uncharacterized protein n=1 Tax=Rhizophora mucronata TaxID=61149 RepID=A0A2P2NUT1_RHIMU